MKKKKPKRCKKCPYYKRPRVRGYGSTELGIAFIGEAPGEMEVEYGRPFTKEGKAGEMLTKILKALKIKRKKCYIDNTVSCRPPKNANPKAKAIQLCRKRLWRTLMSGDFKLIVCLGRFAGTEIIGPNFRWGRFRRMPQIGENVVAVALYHPAYYCYRGDDLASAIQDYKVLKKWLKHPDVFDRKAS